MIVLRGDRNQCQACKQYFNSTFAFDKHRRGDFQVERKCLTPEEMLKKKMSLNAKGFWITAQRLNFDQEVDMLETIAGALVIATMLALGAILFVFVCAMIGWMIYSTQYGEDDE